MESSNANGASNEHIHYQDSANANPSENENDCNDARSDLNSRLEDLSLNSKEWSDYFKPFEILTIADVKSLQTTFVDNLVEVTHLDPVVALDLLKSFNWDKDSLMERFYEWDIDNSLEDSRLSQEPANKKKTNKNQSNGSLDCEICLSKYPFEEMEAMDECDHKYCKNCWKYYLEAKIQEEGFNQFISCMTPECATFITEDTVFRLLKESKALNLYQKMVLKNFVESCPNLTWCPGPGCTLAAKVLNKEPQLIKCKCGFVYCFICTDNWHHPVPCKYIQKWKKESSENHLNQNWLASNTKDCPKCSAPIEKNGGCNHITCKNGSCNYHFCWICLGPWINHNCNGNIPENRKAHNNLERFQHFSNVFNSHKQSLFFEKNIISVLKENNNLPLKELLFFKRATQRLCECRRLLMDTLAFSFYLKTNNDAMILEMNQNDLHLATEDLSEFLEDLLIEDNIASIKDSVFHKSSYCWERRKILIDHIIEGLVNESWKFVE